MLDSTGLQLLALAQSSTQMEVLGDVYSQFTREAQFNYSQYIRSMRAMELRGEALSKFPSSMLPQTFSVRVNVNPVQEWITDTYGVDEITQIFYQNLETFLQKISEYRPSKKEQDFLFKLLRQA